ncbi:hypothetical protein H0H81_004624 [Sphagnurus paluster]|uniref:Uncharacterized protein n=1 Tax=Sphagnurus paluster TaxID=117069 RepID=A0A9P7FLJ3_9AGAR|nr:hypothetical protein H0H81_004624 [Sphagnurus paluster]
MDFGLFEPKSKPDIGLANGRDWVNINTINCFLGVEEDHDVAEGGASTLWESSDPDVLMEYLDWLVPESLPAREFLTLENIESWFLDDSEYLNRLLTWKPSNSQSEELQDCFLELFPHGHDL